MVEGRFTILNLKDIGCEEDIPETSSTLKGNALQKARFVREHYGLDCFADDTGLLVDALSGRPGVFSARYAGEGTTYEDNMNKVLREMQDKTNRAARFITVIALILNNEEYCFEGCIEGDLLAKPRGRHGFGYDPIFRPTGYTQTFAELGDAVKNKISHRALAVYQLLDFLFKKL